MGTTNRSGPSWMKKNTLMKIDSFKYKDKCSFRVFLGGRERYVITNMGSPYTKSLLRVLKMLKSYGDEYLIMIDKNSVITYDGFEDLEYHLLNSFYEQKYKVDEVISKIKRKNDKCITKGKIWT